MSEQKLIHLLKPKEFRVWCRPNDVPGDFGVTSLPSKCTCANCLTVYRSTTTGNFRPFKVSHTAATRKLRHYDAD